VQISNTGTFENRRKCIPNPNTDPNPNPKLILNPKPSVVGTGGSGGSMNRGPRAPGPQDLGPPSSGATEKFRQDS